MFPISIHFPISGHDGCRTPDPPGPGLHRRLRHAPRPGTSSGLRAAGIVGTSWGGGDDDWNPRIIHVNCLVVTGLEPWNFE